MKKDVTRLSRLIVVTLISLTHETFAGSCSSAKLCCQGRDSGCVIQKESPNAIIQSQRDKPCYCDHACLKLADCCDDFKETCGVVDCAVSEWSPWSPCDNGCGSGTQRRSRVIETSEKNGGKHCPRLGQVRTCRSYQACRAGARQQTRAKGVTVLALSPGEGNNTDVRIKDTIIGESGSCVAFTILRVSRACSKISDLFSEGTRICVEHRGDDSLGRYVGVGRWKLATDTIADGRRVRSPSSITCHGKWIGDPRLTLDCQDQRCKPRSSGRAPHVSQLFQSRNRRDTGVAVSGEDDGASRDRFVSRRARGGRWKRSRRRGRTAVER